MHNGEFLIPEDLFSADKPKPAFRKLALARIRTLTAAEKSAHSRRMYELLRDSELFQSAKNLFFFSAVESEPKTLPLFVLALSLGKRVASPKITPPDRMDAFVVTSLSDFVPGILDILTPKGDKGVILPEDVDLILVPGLFYTLDGKRLGRGGGYYDRYLLKTREDAIKIGICFSCQIVDDLPMEPHDLKVDYLLTERGLMPAHGH